jgi:hypothetical protein
VTLQVTWKGWLPVRLTLSDPESYVTTSTKQFDTVAITHLKYVLYPLAVGCGLLSALFCGGHVTLRWSVLVVTGLPCTPCCMTSTNRGLHG